MNEIALGLIQYRLFDLLVTVLLFAVVVLVWWFKR